MEIREVWLAIRDSARTETQAGILVRVASLACVKNSRCKMVSFHSTMT